MYNKKTLEQMSTTEATRAGITSLADRPNDASRYGDGGLSATMLKERFDALPNLVREKFNKIAEVLAGTDAAKYIGLDGSVGDVDNLYDFLLLFGSRGDGAQDKNISDYIETLYDVPLEDTDGNKNYSRTLKDIVQSIMSRFADVETNKGAEVELVVEEKTGEIKLRLLNAAGVVLGDEQKVGPVKTAGIADGAVTEEKLSSLSVSTDKLDDEAVTEKKIAPNSVTEKKIADGSVRTSKLAGAAVTNGKIAPTAVSTEKLADAAVTGAKLADAAVTGAKLADAAVTGAKLADAAVTGAKLAAGSVSEEKLTLAISGRLKALEDAAFTDISYNAKKGELIFTTTNGAVVPVDLPLEFIVSENSYFDDTPGAEAAVLVLANGGEIRIPIDSMTSRLVEYMNGIRERMFDLQEAPPISSLADALLLTTPTLAQLATLS